MSGTSSGSSEPDDPLADFAQVMAALRIDALPDLALEIRREASPNSHVAPFLTCTVTDHPITGAFNIVYELRFSDGVQWMLKVPKAGHTRSWDDSAAKSLTTEASTMNFLKQKTTIPVPNVLDFSAFVENRLNAPYILMEKITGVSLSDFWYDRNFTREERRSRNGRLLPELAATMLQMNAFTFNEGGSPLFASDDQISGVGPLRLKDFNDEYASFVRTSGEDDDYIDVFREIGPFKTPKEQLSWALHDRRRLLPANHKYIEGMERMLELFMSWIPEAYTPLPHGDPHVPEGQHQAFVLSHADFDTQNIIVTNDGHLAGFIDWDGVAIVPRLLGNERYPLWLTHDWNPFSYFYDEDEDQVRPHSHSIGDSCCQATDSPDDLDFYRKLYQSTIIDLSKTILGGPDQISTATNNVDLEESIRRVHSLTINSLIISTLETACMSKFGFDAILAHIWERIEELVGDNSDAKSSTDTGGDSDGELATSQTGEANTHSPDLLNDEQYERSNSPSDSVEDDSTGEQSELSEPGDDGKFRFLDICCALADDALDKERYQRLKDGFERLFVWAGSTDRSGL